MIFGYEKRECHCWSFYTLPYSWYLYFTQFFLPNHAWCSFISDLLLDFLEHEEYMLLTLFNQSNYGNAHYANDCPFDSSSPWFPSVFPSFSLFFLPLSSSSLLVSNLRGEQGRITGRISRYRISFFTDLLLPLNHLFHIRILEWCVMSFHCPRSSFSFTKKVNVNGLIMIISAYKQMTFLMWIYTSSLVFRFLLFSLFCSCKRWLNWDKSLYKIANIKTVYK